MALKLFLLSIFLLSLLDGKEETDNFFENITGKFTEEVTYSYNGSYPHSKVTSLKSSLLLGSEYKFNNNWRFKTNVKAYSDAIYYLRDKSFSDHEVDELQNEVELFDAYIQGSINDNIDVKLGRQVVVFGRSDTIRITDILNPLDNRHPGIVDNEDLYLPVAMAKFDYFIEEWRITPIVILEQRFSKNPPFGSDFYPTSYIVPDNIHYNDITYALSIGGEFSNWDLNFYAAKVYNDAGYIPIMENSKIRHDKISMFGIAQNFVNGSWLFKTEVAYFDGLKYSSTQEKKFMRTDALIGVEYNGMANTLITYDFSVRHLNNYDDRLLSEFNFLEKNTYQQAFRINSNFINETLHFNYLISLFGNHLNKGGYQRVWSQYDIKDNIHIDIGVLDFIGGTTYFNKIKDNDMIFTNINYFF